jgi:hypothetical protein
MQTIFSRFLAFPLTSGRRDLAKHPAEVSAADFDDLAGGGQRCHYQERAGRSQQAESFSRNGTRRHNRRVRW